MISNRLVFSFGFLVFLVAIELVLAKNERIFVDEIGFNDADSSVFFQKAVDSGYKEIVLRNVKKNWVLGPIFLSGNQKIILEEGVVISGNPAVFEKAELSIFNAVGQRNIKIIGKDCKIIMPEIKTKLQSHWTFRNCISLWGCGNIEISGINFQGGQPYGIGVFPCIEGYPEFLPCRGIKINNCEFTNNNSGISLYSVQDIEIQNCEFSNSNCGISINPLSTVASLKNICVKNSGFHFINGFAFVFDFGEQVRYRPWGEQKELSILIEDCNVYDSLSGVMIKNLLSEEDISNHLSNSPRRPGGWEGNIDFKSCSFKNISQECMEITNKSSKSAIVKFDNCRFERSVDENDLATDKAMFYLNKEENAPFQLFGGVEFSDCQLKSETSFPAVLLKLPPDDCNVANLKGNINVFGKITDYVITQPEGVITDIIINK